MDILKEFDINTDSLCRIKDGNIFINKNFIKVTATKYYENLVIEKISSFEESSKLLLFKHLYQYDNSQHYLLSSKSEYRILISKMRLSDHNLLIEKGRHLKIPRDQRLCTTCKIVDNEQHFILHCKNNSIPRETYLDFIKQEKKDFINMEDDQKLIYILNPSTPTQVNKLGSFIKQSYALRTGGS